MEKEKNKGKVEKPRRDSDVSDDWSSDEEDRKNAEAAAAGEKLVGKKRKRKDKDDVADFFTTEAIEEVPADDPATLQEQGYDPEDSDEIAELRVLARKMLRKKDREAMLDASYNRYTFNDDRDKLPTWF
jgi:AdoMet-dependent rRNA methyltransferase SPB1